MNVEKTVMILGMFPYNFKDEKTGNQISGCTLHYCDPDESVENGIGVKPVKSKIELEEFAKHQYSSFPATATLKGYISLSNMRLEVKSIENVEQFLIAE